MFLDTDHSGLNKFIGPSDENFLLVGPEIERMVEEAPQRIEARYRCTVHLLYTPEISSLKDPLISVKYTPWVPEKHKDKKTAEMTRRRDYSRPSHRIIRATRTASQRGSPVPASGFSRMIDS